MGEVARRAAVRSVAARCVVLLVLALGFTVVGRRRLAGVLLVAAFLWLAVALVAPRRVGSIDAALDRFGRAVGTAIGTILSFVLMALGILPLWLLSKVVRVSPLDSGWTTSSTAWISLDGRRGGPAGTAGRAGRMAAPELARGPAVRWRLRARNLLGLAVVAAVVFAAVIAPDDAPPAGRPVRLLAGFPFKDYAFQDEPWAYDLYLELDDMIVLQDLVLGYVLEQRYDGKYVNLRDGHRVTRQPEATPKLRVWFFGGSTMFGLGQRDGHTIPSDISALAESDGVPIEAVNFGVPGYTNWTEMQQYLQLLSSDEPLPDLVVFYDGINEFTLANERVAIGDIDPNKVSMWAQTAEAKAIFRQSVEKPVRVPSSKRDEVIPEIAGALYGRGIRAIRKLSDASEIDSLFYWQPTLQTKAESPVDLPVFQQLGAQQSWVPSQRKVYNAIAERSGEQPIDLSRALDGATKPVFMDWSHTNELGARMVAKAMYRTLGPKLHELVRQERSGG